MKLEFWNILQKCNLADIWFRFLQTYHSLGSGICIRTCSRRLLWFVCENTTNMFNRNYLHVILRLLFIGYLFFSLFLFLFMYEPCFTYQNWRFWCYNFEIQLEHFEDSIWRFSLAIQIFNGLALVYVSRRKNLLTQHEILWK